MRKIAFAALAAFLALSASLVLRRGSPSLRRDDTGAVKVLRPLDLRVSLTPEAQAARNGSGTFSLYTPGNPVQTATTITSAWANNTLSDIATELTDSLDRSGKGGMLASLRGVAGTVSSPAYSWTAETNSGLYRAGSHDLRFAVNGADDTFWNATGFGVGRAPTAFRLEVADAASGNAVAQFGATLPIFLSSTIPAVGFNSYYDGVNNRYSSAGFAALMQMETITGDVVWQTAPSGLAAANATMTERLRLKTGGDLQAAANLLMSGTSSPTIKATGSNQTLTLQGNRSAADTGTDVVINSTATRTNGNLLDVQNNTVSKFTLNFAGVVTTPFSASGATTLTGGAAVSGGTGLTIGSGGTAISSSFYSTVTVSNPTVGANSCSLLGTATLGSSTTQACFCMPSSALASTVSYYGKSNGANGNCDCIACNPTGGGIAIGTGVCRCRSFEP